MTKQLTKIFSFVKKYFLTPEINGRRLLIASWLNFTLLITMFFLVIVNVSFNSEAYKSIGTLRLLVVLIVTIINIFLIKSKLFKLFKISLIFLPPIILFYIPSLLGYTENESYFYYQISIIALSIFPALILSHIKEKKLLFISLFYFLLLIFFIDNIITWLSPEPLPIYEYIKHFYLYYKLIPIIIFLFFHGSVYYLRQLNYNSELKLIKTSQKSELQNKELRERNEEVELQREMIIRQKKDLTDSITYAKYIQTGLLPAEKIMDYLFPNYFVLNLPRDIVSGDFYWVAKQQDVITVVLADCMGHGVPGAFISILGISILKEVYNSNRDLPTGTFMNEVRERIMLSLNQTGTRDDLKIGMDVSLIKINRKTKQVSFTGANHNLYYFKKGNFNEIKGDRMPVGVQIGRNHSFSTHEFQLEKGDSIYMLSDGYADQFGGEKGKKYSYPRFKKRLDKLVTLPVNEQKEILKTELKNWQGKLDQVDDIIVLGIKL